ncbi:ArsR/SmtB family transcription factor [Tengunoibacter tsumagoiensis]|uniref:Transcriptional regulator n=1 Tax=Tengunoibacter tsumagoiensis TaxID=2014871 RepID=A0A402A7P7_9CHLR|nr:metalloregulator ArsR/SmtB family transcription factor [Tengunoibacter tsumagoiensis]GCE15173.1 transcriptional regulator [Tengunoibacter tsumagoiensis]
MPSVDVSEEPLRSRLQMVLSPVSEMLTSLHVLADPGHHLSNQEWASATQNDLPLEVREVTQEIERYQADWIHLIDLLYLDGRLEMAVLEFLDYLAGLPPRQVVDVLLEGLPDVAAFGWINEPLEQGDLSTSWIQLRIDPEPLVTRLLVALKSYWEQIFHREWEHRRPLLEQCRAQQAIRLDSMEPPQWLASLHARIEYDRATDTVVFHKRHELRFPLEEMLRIVCTPSTFAAPHLMVGYGRGLLNLTMHATAALTDLRTIPPGILPVAKALSDETRLQIYKLVLKRPHYTQEIAFTMKLAEPTVSRHLKVLRDAGLVQSRKEGLVVLYTGLLNPVDAFAQRVREFLRN